MNHDTEALLAEYRTNVDLFIHTDEIRQTRINWNFLVQAALLAAVLSTNREAAQISAAIAGATVGIAAFFIAGRHSAYQHLRTLQAREIEEMLKERGLALTTFTRELDIFRPVKRRAFFDAVGRVIPLPQGLTDQPFARSGETLYLPFAARFSANQMEGFVLGVVIPIFWTAIFVLTVLGKI